jgi:hypothetical protein
MRSLGRSDCRARLGERAVDNSCGFKIRLELEGPYVTTNATLSPVWLPKPNKESPPLGGLFINKILAPQVRFELTTLRLTAGCSAIELLRNIQPAHDRDRAGTVFITNGPDTVKRPWLAIKGRFHILRYIHFEPFFQAYSGHRPNG